MRVLIAHLVRPVCALRIPIRGYEAGEIALLMGALTVTNPYKGL